MDFGAWGHELVASTTVRLEAMSSVNRMIRAATILSSLAGLACAPAGRPGGATSTGSVGATGEAGAATGIAGNASGGDATGAGTAGAVDPPGAAGAPSATGTGGAGGVDQGLLFTDAAVVSLASADAGATSTPDATVGDAGNAIPGDGNVGTCHIGGSNFVLVFTQKGKDVTMVVTATNCAAGTHTFQIHAGFSCDNAGTEGGVWDGARGAGIPTLTCANNKGTLTYTRAGTDPTTNWTVGDHNTKTDVTLHPMSADSSCGTFF
jgi:hypothetical protein